MGSWWILSLISGVAKGLSFKLQVYRSCPSGNLPSFVFVTSESDGNKYGGLQVILPVPSIAHITIKNRVEIVKLFRPL